MSHTYSASAFVLLTVPVTTIASAAQMSVPQAARVIGYSPSSGFDRKYETPSAPVCPPGYNPEHTSPSSRAYCPDAGLERPLLSTGQVVPAGFGQPIGFSQLNSALRAHHRLDPERDFVFASGYLYDVDHASRTVKRVIPVEIQRQR